MQPLVEHRLELGGFGTRALELEGDGPPVLLLHGFADSADTWRQVLDRLARRNRRALAVDLPGFAKADRLDRDAPVLDQLRTFAHAAVEHLAAEQGGPVVVMGNSLGGCTALRVAEDPALPVLAVVPVAPAGFDMPRWFSIIERDPFVRTLLASPLPLPGPLMRVFVGEAYRQLAFARPRAVAAELVNAFTEHHLDRRAVRRYLDNGRRMLPELSGCFALERVTCPVMLVWGDRDRMVTHRGSRWVLEALPATRFELYEGVGHCPQVEVPDRLVEDLESFLLAPAPAVAG
ncbi:alpha/beta fold hydrolase [Conexibacter sp. SYSU D00693]|uniref:alpha/beta fold hydrolase n=1 Tax=Conexibacter sp. SYSU D00693 TaxID=2812560 RepID=UPI00196B5FD8|nr:alpha/beta hydrolase [Conexibacter sp. SYSU D00693]